MTTDDENKDSFYWKNRDECIAKAHAYYKRNKTRILAKARASYAMKASGIKLKRRGKYRSDPEYAERKREYNRERNKRLRAEKKGKSTDITDNIIND